MFPQIKVRHNDDGFTLIEVLVALAIVAAALASIGSLIATSVRGTRSIEARLLRLQTMRTVVTALPDRDQLLPGTLAGKSGDQLWRLDISAFNSPRLGQDGTHPLDTTTYYRYGEGAHWLPARN